MHNFSHDKNLIFTLDAGGTNFAFNAFQAAKSAGNPFSMAAEVVDLKAALKQIIGSFEKLATELGSPQAISFAFPGPANYQQGIIYNKGNLPAFAGGVPLAQILSDHFKVPVYINNDGDLFTYGEAMFGSLRKLNKNSSIKYTSLLGLTLGTGLGGGLTINDQMYLGTNSNGLEVWTLRLKRTGVSFAEEGISKRFIIKAYGDDKLSPLDIYQIATGVRDGDQQRAINVFMQFGENLAEILMDLIAIFDCPIVIGGGLARSRDLFMSKVLEILNNPLSRLAQKCFWATSEQDLLEFSHFQDKKIPILFCEQGTNQAVQLGAYAYAINQLKKEGTK
jgi:glucokinase